MTKGGYGVRNLPVRIGAMIVASSLAGADDAGNGGYFPWSRTPSFYGIAGGGGHEGLCQ